jgi:hypothetical protein
VSIIRNEHEFSKGFKGDLDYYAVDGYDVFSWSPAPPGTKSAKPTQVHIMLPIGETVRVVMRLKSKRAVDELIAVLQEHRNDVWGKP